MDTKSAFLSFLDFRLHLWSILGWNLLILLFKAVAVLSFRCATLL